MKVIIDIPEEDYEWVQTHQSVTDYQTTLKLYKSVINGTPLDDIKAEIKEWYWQADKQALAKDPCVVDAMVDLFIRTIE